MIIQIGAAQQVSRRQMSFALTIWRMCPILLLSESATVSDRSIVAIRRKHE